MLDSKQTTNALLLLTILNHATWSTLHIAARYLQVYATPMVFDGQGLLSSAKGFAALFLFLLGIVSSWIESCQSIVHDGGKGGGDVVSVQIYDDRAGSPNSTSLSSVNATLSASASCLCNSNHSVGIKLDEKGATSKTSDTDIALIQQSKSPEETPLSRQTEGYQSVEYKELDVSSSRIQRRRKQVIYTLLFAFVSTSRASSNIASSKYTYPYNITLIASLTPVIIAIFDRILLHSPFPPLLWPTILLSSLGGFLIAISQSMSSNDNGVSEKDKITPMDNLIGCSLQLLSAIFSAFARILMKRTEHILTPTHIVQTNNISNCLFPFIYTIFYNPSSWRAFRYLIFNPKSLLAWCTMSIGVYSFASTLQIRLVRNLGPGFYSSWVAVRVLGSMILSACILGEGIDSWLEWVGVGLMVVTISVYLVETRKWMDHRKEQQQEEGEDKRVQIATHQGEVGIGDEELVPVPSGEGEPLLTEAKAKHCT